jgi:hypothetical protein
MTETIIITLHKPARAKASSRIVGIGLSALNVASSSPNMNANMINMIQPNTLIYTQLVDFKEEEYVCKVAKTVEEACKLIEAGFEYVCNFDDVKLFRKRK